MEKERLWSCSYLLVCIASFLTSFSFFLLVPTLPFYLVSELGVEQGMVGVLLSCYVVAVLCVRPFAGCVADIFPRKKVYLISYMLFALAFVGYLGIISSVAAFVLLRIFHGFAFGALTTTANTLVIDIMPSSRRGEGLGYYGVMNNLAMASGPMTGLFIISSGNYTLLFAVALVTIIVGLVMAMVVRAPEKRGFTARQGKTCYIGRPFLSLCGYSCLCSNDGYCCSIRNNNELYGGVCRGGRPDYKFGTVFYCYGFWTYRFSSALG